MIKVISKRDLLNEALGVPDGLPETARQIYYDIINNILPSYDFNKLNGLEVLINGNYRIADYKFNKFRLKLEIVQSNKFDILNMGSGADMSMGKDIKKDVGRVGNTRNMYFQSGADLRTKKPYGFDLSLVFSGPKMLRGVHILKFFIIEKDKMIKVIGHELMHLYDFYKNQRKDINKQVKGFLSQEFAEMNLNIPSIDKFSMMLYFVNTNENIVRMSEIGTGIVDGNITKSRFLDMLKNDDTVQMLQSIKGYKFSDFQNDLLKDKKQILNYFQNKNVIDIHGANYLYNHDYTYLGFVMNVFTKTFISAEANLLRRMLSSSKFTDTEKDEIYERHKKQIFKNVNSGKDYFEKMIKSFNFEAEKVLRKIFKLFAMAKDVPNPKLPKAMKRMKTESKWINMKHWDKQPKKGFDFKDGTMKGYIY
jgi:hypothetical protein